MQKPSQLSQMTRAFSLMICTGWTAVQAGPTAITPEVLATGVQSWVAKQQGLGPQEVSMVPLDARVKARTCEGELRYEYPFPSAETVKVMCKAPAWHLFVRVNLPTSNARPGQTAPVQASAPQAVRKVWVVSQHVSAGSAIQANQISREDRDSAVIGPQALDPQADISYSEAIRDLPPGTIVKQYDIRPQVLVKRGQLVQIVIGQSQGFQIVARVEAMQDGRYGEQIKVKNPESGRILTGVVKGPAMVAGS